MKIIFGMVLPVLFVLAACSQNNKPDKWIFLSNDNNSKLYYTLDKMSKSDTKLVKIWVKTVFNDIKRIEDKEISYSKNMYMIKCTENKYKVNVGFNFTKDNEVASKTVVEQENAMPLIIDKSNKEIVFNSNTTVQDAYLPILSNSPASRLHSIVCN